VVYSHYLMVAYGSCLILHLTHGQRSGIGSSLLTGKNLTVHCVLIRLKKVTLMCISQD
jgi:hypothetical protein